MTGKNGKTRPRITHTRGVRGGSSIGNVGIPPSVGRTTA